MLRAISSRAQITRTSLINTYSWGNFKGDPVKLMDRCFDLHLYLANWGTRRLMIRLPKGLVQRKQLDRFLRDVSAVTVHDTSGHLILDISQDEVDLEDWVDGSGQLGALVPLREGLLAGDQRVLYLAWLTAVQAEDIAEDAREPLPGIGPMTGPLEAFADFFGIDPDLVAAAAELQSEPPEAVSAAAANKVIAGMSDSAKTDMLLRLFKGDPYVGAELRAKVQQSRPHPLETGLRTAGALQVRATAIRTERLQAAAQKAAEQRRTQEKKIEQERQARLRALQQRGEQVWRDIETEIDRRASPGYEKAASLLMDLRAIAQGRGEDKVFAGRLETIRHRHARKLGFIKRIAAL